MRVSRRWVVVSVVAALVVGAGVSTASANVPVPAAVTGPVDVAKCADAGYSTMEALCAVYLALARSANPGDLDSRDLRVAAPSSVITATGSESPTRRVQEVNSWRPNPQSWIDAKTRLAGTSGLTSDALNSTARWAPKLLKGASIAGVLSGDSLLTWITRDGMLVPMLEKVAPQIDVGDTMNNTYCQRFGNIVTDWVAGWTGASCPEWRLDKEFAELVGGRSYKPGPAYCIGSHCATITGIAPFNQWDSICVNRSGPSGEPTTSEARNRLEFSYRSTSNPTGVTMLTDFPSRGALWPGGCGGVGERFNVLNGPTGATIMNVRWVRPDGSKFDAMEVAPGAAEWMTRVRCLDGSSRFAVSESFQQEKLGKVVSPSSVQLNGCKPVGVDVGVQKKGAAGNGAGGGWDSVPGGDRVGVQTSDVPQPVRDWLTNFPGCEAGTCLLELKKSVGGTMEIDCFSSPDSCAEWQKESAAGTSTYNCYYAKTLVALAECNVYGPTFQRDKVQNGTGYSDPKTGEKVETSTGSSVTTNPGAATQAMNDPARDPATSRQCWPKGWAALNPFEWVFTPVKCALEWAFVPKESVFKSFRSNLNARFAKTSFGAVAGIVTAIEVPGVGDGCTGPPFSFKYGPVDETWYPFSACEAPMAGVAATIKLWLGFLITAGAVLAIVRYITAIIGFIPYGGGSGGGGRRGPRFEVADE